jgi:hypothetical protein
MHTSAATPSLLMCWRYDYARSALNLMSWCWNLTLQTRWFGRVYSMRHGAGHPNAAGGVAVRAEAAGCAHVK